jgi:hypothetical protein
MKKTIITKEIDGQEIVIGFDVPIFDPEATKVAARDLVAAIPGDAEKKEKALSIAQKQRQLKNATPEAAAVLNAEIAALRQELHDLANARQVEILKIWKENAVYFEPKKGEYIHEEEDLVELMQKMSDKPADKLLLRTGEYISDYRNRIVYEKIDNRWEKSRMEKLGDVPKNFILKEGLNLTQLTEIQNQTEADRKSVMTSEQLQAEKEILLNEALNQAAIKKAAGDLQEDPDALSKAKAWLEQEQLRIEALY